VHSTGRSPVFLGHNVTVPSANTQANSEYAQRINRVIDYLRGNLHRPMKLAELADVACFSEFHFHRIFTAVAGETLNHFQTGFVLKSPPCGCPSAPLRAGSVKVPRVGHPVPR